MISKLHKILALARAKWILRRFTCGKRVTFDPDVRFFAGRSAQIVFEDRVRVGRACGFGISGGYLRVGARTYFGGRTRINVATSVDIGQDCAIAWDCDILDSDFHRVRNLDGSLSRVSAPVVIADRVWIGAGVKILKGTTIGEDSVVAAGAIVSGSFPPKSLIAGSPARVVRQIDGWDP